MKRNILHCITHLLLDGTPLHLHDPLQLHHPLVHPMANLRSLLLTKSNCATLTARLKLLCRNRCDVMTAVLTAAVTAVLTAGKVTLDMIYYFIHFGPGGLRAPCVAWPLLLPSFSLSFFPLFWPRRLACAMRACVRHA